ncbi:sensor domain-containing diguanylate cyclase [Paenibacillus turpanensis]|uniref:sensor domain-containing diguanylate cyclase n=1 Tax=Paenibacillus turpanensis TaxID=2689078 RepID=UPI001408F17B|nr:diguanylate cyclase [Paenibacillus turpanensis]
MTNNSIPKIVHFSLILAILILSTGFTAFPTQLHFTQDHHPNQAVDGVIDLRTIKSSTAAQLDGEWRFYWSRLLTPNEIAFQEPGYERIHVPSSWHTYRSSEDSGAVGGSLPRFGIATYSLRILLPNEKQMWALSIPSISASYKLYVNGELLHSNGTVGKTAMKTIARSEKQLLQFYSESGEAELVIQVANFSNQRSGIVNSIVLGEHAFIVGQQQLRIAYEMFLIGSLFVMTVYHIGLYVMRRKEPSSLYFGLFCLLIAVRSLIIGETFIYKLIPPITWDLVVIIDYFCMCAAVISFTLFLRRIYPNEMNKRVAQAIVGFAGSYIGFIVLTPPRIFTNGLPYLQLFILLSISYALFVFVLAFFRRRDGALFTAAGAVVLTISIFNDILANRGIIHSGYFLAFGLFTFIVSQSFVLAIGFSKAFSSSEGLAEKLAHLNNVLEDKVRERTIQLEETNRLLQNQICIDGLTGISNRRHFDEMSAYMLRKAAEEKRTFSLLLLDIDHFKMYNDTYGHLAGDDCLKQVSALLQEEAEKAGGMAARYGGEEFAIVLMSETEDAEALAQKLVEQVAGLAIPHATSKTAPYVTISTGIAVYKPVEELGDEVEMVKKLIQTADQALYQVKQAGRNGYTLASFGH